MNEYIQPKLTTGGAIALRVGRLESENRKLREALRWYAEGPERNQFHMVTADDKSFLSDMADWGDRARKALASSTEDGPK